MIQGNSTITKDVPTYCIGYGRNCLAGINTIGLKRSGMDKKHIQEIKNLFLEKLIQFLGILNLPFLT